MLAKPAFQFVDEFDQHALLGLARNFIQFGFPSALLDDDHKSKKNSNCPSLLHPAALSSFWRTMIGLICDCQTCDNSLVGITRKEH